MYFQIFQVQQSNSYTKPFLDSDLDLSDGELLESPGRRHGDFYFGTYQQIYVYLFIKLRYYLTYHESIVNIA